ncbi:MAG TPA: type I methionyl aminopeptidase [Bacteroidetes bacterium]|nr:type I methionyl aminopeptidase [Bacteroidota bacterium]
MIYLKSHREIEKMRRAGRLLASVFLKLADLIKPGAVTAEIDGVAERVMRDAGARPAFKGYKGPGRSRFPTATCISIDSEIVHGIPSQRRLREGQIVGIDAGVELDGWYADMAGSFLIGKVDDIHLKLWRVTREALYRGIEQVRPGNRISDIGSAIQSYAEDNGFSVIRDLVGHGIGSHLHEDPAVPNYSFKRGDTTLKAGMTIAIEPMISTGDYKIKVLDDGWTAVTADGSPAGHFEHTIHVNDGEPEILTLLEDTRDPWLSSDIVGD